MQSSMTGLYLQHAPATCNAHFGRTECLDRRHALTPSQKQKVAKAMDYVFRGGKAWGR